MSMQKEILKAYRSHYPNAKLREVSQQTGIQLTRVFRLFNGAQMRLDEYEAFEKAIRPQEVQKAKEDFVYKKTLQQINQLHERHKESLLCIIQRKIQKEKYAFCLQQGVLR